MSPLAVEAEQRSGQLKALPLRDVELTRQLRAVHDRQVRLGGVARRFWSWLQKRRQSVPESETFT